MRRMREVRVRNGVNILVVDVGREIGAARPGLPVLYMSGYGRDATVHAGRLEQGVNFLEKPFTRKALAAAVRMVLDRPRAGS